MRENNNSWKWKSCFLYFSELFTRSLQFFGYKLNLGTNWFHLKWVYSEYLELVDMIWKLHVLDTVLVENCGKLRHM